jgi:hypothetical protein
LPPFAAVEPPGCTGAWTFAGPGAWGPDVVSAERTPVGREMASLETVRTVLA